MPRAFCHRFKLYINLRRGVLFGKSRGTGSMQPQKVLSAPWPLSSAHSYDISIRHRFNASPGQGQGWLRSHRIKAYPKEGGESLSVVANSEIVGLGSDHFDDVFIKLSLFSLKGSKQTLIAGWNTVCEHPFFWTLPVSSLGFGSSRRGREREGRGAALMHVCVSPPRLAWAVVLTPRPGSAGVWPYRFQ